MTTTFDESGFTTKPDAGTWTWGLDLQGYAWRATNPVTKPRATSAAGGRLSRVWDTQLIEWYVTDSRGLEHGFTVASRPRNATAPMTVDLSIRGGLQPFVSQDGRSITFTDAQGGTALNYNGLTVFDAAGETVSAKGYPMGINLLWLQVDDATAHYPLTIDPVVQQAYFKSSNSGESDRFGVSVAISGDTVLVGAKGEDSNATGVDGNEADSRAANSGAAYVFVCPGSVWSQEAYLKASNTGVGDEFGVSVAICGDTVVVGAESESSNATGVNGSQANNSAVASGAAYIFTIFETLDLLISKGRIFDSTKPGKDTIRVVATYSFLPDSRDGAFDPVNDGLRFRLGPESALFSTTIPAGDLQWKTSPKNEPTRFTWRSAKGAVPKVTVVIDTKKSTITLKASQFDLSSIPTDSVFYQFETGCDLGSALDVWKIKNGGVLVFP